MSSFTMACFGYIVTFSSLLILSAAKNGPAHDKVIVCYATSESTLNETQFSIENTDLNLCTHLIYADNLDVSPHTTGPWLDREDTKEYGRFTGLRQKYQHLKVSLSIKHYLKDYLRISAEPEKSLDFISDAADYVLRHEFDGLDLLWEFSDISETRLQPNQSFDGYDLNSDNIQTFLKRLKKTFKLHNLLLTSTFVATTENIAEVLELPAVSQHLDFMHFVQKYNFNWKPQADIISHSIKIRGIGNTQQMIDGLIERGVAPDKLVLGLQFSGLLFRSIQDLDHFYEPTYRRSLAYNEVCDALTKFPGWQKTYDAESGLTTAKRIELASSAFLPQLSTIVYESGRMIARKVQFALSRKIAGVMVFPIDMDDFVGNCPFERDTFADFEPRKGVNLNIEARENRKFPLLKTVNEAIVAPLEIIDPNVKKPIIPIALASSNGLTPNFLQRLGAFNGPFVQNTQIPISFSGAINSRVLSNLPSSQNGEVLTNSRIIPSNLNIPLLQRGTGPTNVKIFKIRRPIHNVKMPFKSTYDDYDLEILDSLLSL